MTASSLLQRPLHFHVSTLTPLLMLTLSLFPGGWLNAQQHNGNVSVEFPGQVRILRTVSPAGVALEKERRPVAMVSADFDQDGVADLAIGYGLNKGGAIELMRGNHDAIAPQSHASWLAAGRHEPTVPFLPATELIQLPCEPDFLLAADLNGDGHRDLVFATRGGGQLQALIGTGKGTFLPGLASISLPGAVTAVAAYRPGGSTLGEALMVGYESKQGAGLVIIVAGRAGLKIVATYALPGPATALAVANLDDDFIPDTAIVAGGQLLVLHGRDAIAGEGKLETLPVSTVEAVAAGEFIFDRHAGLQLGAVTTNGDVVILAHQGLDSRLYSPEEIRSARRNQRAQSGSLTLAQLAGNTSKEPWAVVETDSGAGAHSAGSAAPILMRTRIGGSGGDDLVVLNSAEQQRVTISHAAGTPGTADSSAGRLKTSNLGSESVIAAVPVRVNADGRPGLAMLSASRPTPEFTVPSAGNTFYVNTTADNTGNATDPDDGVRCSNGSGEVCTLRDAVIFANADSAINIEDSESDTIMVPAGVFDLTWQAGVLDSNGNAVTHLEVLGPVTFVGDTTGNGVLIDPEARDVVFTINPGPYGSFNPGGKSFAFDTTLENLIIINGKNSNNLSLYPNANDVGGGINWDAYGTGNLTLDNSYIEICSILYGAGGGLWVENSLGGGTGTVTLTGGGIYSNSTPEEGGAVYVANPPVALVSNNSVFEANTADPSVNTADPGGFGSGGGLFFSARSSGSGTPQSTLTGATIYANEAGVEGGGIYTNSGILLTDSVVQSNSSGQWGGGVYTEEADPELTATITSTNILQNSATTTGGGVYVGADNPSSGFSLDMGLSRIFGNTSASGTTGLALASPGAAIATENWWGCNAGPLSTSVCDLADSGTYVSPWAVLTFSADATTFPLGESTDLAVDLNTDSNGQPISGAFPAVASFYPYSYNVTGISENPPLTTGTFDSTGSGSTAITPTSNGPGTVTVTFDNQSLTLNLVVNGVDHFGVTAPPTATAGTPFNVTVTAFDIDDNVVTGYMGTVRFLSSDESAVLPANASLSNGTGTFSVTPETSGVQTVSVVDTTNATEYGTSGAIDVSAGPASLFLLSIPSPVTAYVTNSLTVSAVDKYNNLATSYTGTVKLASSDPTFVNVTGNQHLNGGVGSFNYSLHTSGTHFVTATDTVNSSIKGSSTVLVDLPVGLSASSLSFGSVQVGMASGSQPLIITNTGTVTLTFSSIAVTGTNAASFVFSNGCGSSLAPGANCTFHGHFAPTKTGSLTAAITITDSAGNSPQSVALSGTGVAPPVALSATSLTFPSTTVGSASASQTVIMTNTGTAALAISSIAVTGTNASSFVIGTTCGTSLAAGANCSIHGHFAPTKTGALTAAITITDSGNTSPQTVALSGTGLTPPVTLSATSLSFGSATVGTTTASQTVVVTNTGTAVLSITSIAVTGANASSFAFGNSCGTSLAVGANCSIHGHFAPTTTGALTAAITITDSAGTSPQSIALSGTGLTPPVTLSATSLSFGSVNVGSSSGSQTVIVTNTGAAALSITSIVLTGADASSYAIGNTCGASLAAGANCTIHGHFAPIAAGAMTAAITITDSAITSPQSIALSGTGVAPSAPVTLSPISLTFPATTVGMSSESQYVTMTNTGTATVSITSISVTGANASSFVFANSCGTSLAVGANCSIHGHFQPTATGALTAAVTIIDSASNSPQSIALSGTGQVP